METEKRETFKKRYDFTCCVCDKKLYAEPSIFMTMLGINSGSGICLKCKTPLNLEIYPDIFGECMVSKRWNAGKLNEKM